MAAAICEALRLTGQPGRPVLEAMLDALAPQDVLIVLDNCEHLIGGSAKTAEAIVRRCPRVHLLATSREPLGIGGEVIYRVPSLSLPGPEDSGFAPGSSDAVALFVERARAQGVALSVDGQACPVVVSVCRRLDGMPLAIELAAARLRSMSLGELHDRLDQRFRLLETIRLFAAERLAEAGGEEAATVAAAHCAHFLSLAEAAAAHLTGPEQGSWLARLHADQANLRRAAGYAAGRPDGAAVVLRLGVALDRYWRARSREPQAFGLLVPTLRRPDARADPALFGTALVTAAVVAWFIDVATARQLAEQAVQVARQLGDERLLISALGALCGAHFFAGEPETGRPFGQESVERARRLGNDVLLAVSLRGYLLTIDAARSGPLYAEAIACIERSGDHLMSCILHTNAGDHALDAGDLPAARAHLEAAAQAAQQIGFENAYVQATLGDVLRAERDPDGARSVFEAALRIGRRNGDSRVMSAAMLGLACLAGDAGDWDRAAALHGAAQAFLDRTGVQWQELPARNRQESLDQARARLGDEQLERAYAQGRALSLDQALDLALPKAGPA